MNKIIENILTDESVRTKAQIEAVALQTDEFGPWAGDITLSSKQ